MVSLLSHIMYKREEVAIFISISGEYSSFSIMINTSYMTSMIRDQTLVSTDSIFQAKDFTLYSIHIYTSHVFPMSRNMVTLLHKIAPILGQVSNQSLEQFFRSIIKLTSQGSSISERTATSS